jgi:hypothetical protein
VRALRALRRQALAGLAQPAEAAEPAQAQARAQALAQAQAQAQARWTAQAPPRAPHLRLPHTLRQL